MSASVTNLMNPKKPEEASKVDEVRFFNLFASLPKWMVQSEFNRQTESMHNQLRVKEIHHEDERKINKIVEDNPELTRDEAVNIYYDSLAYETARLAMQFQRGNFLVAEEEYKNLTTYMHDLHDYYMAQALETKHAGFELLSTRHMFSIILMKRSTLSVAITCFSYSRDAISIQKC
jgi:hypothetical protein